MRVSDDGIKLIRLCEGTRYTAYRDGGGIWTIGIGHTRGVTEGLTCIDTQADAWLQEDLSPTELAVMRSVEVSLTQSQFDALVSFTFNVGGTALANSTLRRKLNGGDYVGAADQFPLWVHDAVGNVEPGLVTRRQKEKALFLSGVTP